VALSATFERKPTDFVYSTVSILDIDASFCLGVPQDAKPDINVHSPIEYDIPLFRHGLALGCWGRFELESGPRDKDDFCVHECHWG
jgi:hypothetical protein